MGISWRRRLRLWRRPRAPRLPSPAAVEVARIRLVTARKLKGRRLNSQRRPDSISGWKPPMTTNRTIRPWRSAQTSTMRSSSSLDGTFLLTAHLPAVPEELSGGSGWLSPRVYPDIAALKAVPLALQAGAIPRPSEYGATTDLHSPCGRFAHRHSKFCQKRAARPPGSRDDARRDAGISPRRDQTMQNDCVSIAFLHLADGVKAHSSYSAGDKATATVTALPARHSHTIFQSNHRRLRRTIKRGYLI